MKYLIYLIGLLLFNNGSTYATEKHDLTFSSESERIKYLALNYPDQALNYFKENQKKLLEQNSEQTVSIYSSVLAAASSVGDIKLVEDIAKLLSDPRLVPYSRHFRFTIVNVIGVSYRFNGQFDDAVITYKCALKHARNNVEKMTSKVNLSIAYRMNKQPAISFQILQSIDEAILSGRRKAGLLVVTGNTAIVLDKPKEAISYFIAARQHYLKDLHHRNAARVTVNLLGAALIARRAEVYEKYRKKLTSAYEAYLPKSDQLYLQWLDLMHDSVKSNVVADKTLEYTKTHVVRLLKEGYTEPVRKLLQSLNAEFLMPEMHKKSLMNMALHSGLAKPWCQDL
ncbi:hypothetical protein [Pseudoalteromonas luteoviolacea]|uniref:MalT-like TPR region domain-containing protein n=1 Tax=Pseudoalteromonas luteoviolacea S4054 TaxID=1129367 RepID=A0A0F6AHQ7_9GAMM|nr:hypothetical protein [Pseudoalteromonas luteoviolacea]AOT11050.1 hypothetical protein S4054249_24765 [Pseudoalteromonas luteoviolacea]AOT15786.1 hypothetical protein S40542_23745 [Pseudoalteromonas luteoviolacea]AOT20871.1 hypothetical protein S4054_24685 [Pseudoalteromonas luteoviolacea]KKE85752.1 hypothetical protein N479_24670 [Pseudoalteromonas luteoviolacea S4054]KZN71111.1 hypothetical protein N481_19725 [Pseudoalteromonas luteoviolacea S4047-1]